MTQTALGVLADALGAATREELVQGVRGPELRRSFWQHPSGGVREVQPEKIPVDYAHQGHQHGEVIYLERDHGLLHCVAHIDDTIQPAVNVRVGGQTVAVDHPLYWSGQFDSRPDGSDAQILSVAVTSQTARICATPIRLLPGSLNFHRKPRPDWNNLSSADRGLLERAAVYNAERRKHGGPLIVVDQGHPNRPVWEHGPYQRTDRPTIEVRSATLATTSVTRRLISAIVVPYSTPAIVNIRGKRVREVIAPGAFDRVTEQPHTVRLNMDHRPEKVVGKAVEWDTGRSDGLVGTFRISRTVAGDEALELASQDLVDCSIGFGIEHESWPQPDMRMVHAGFVDHVALTSSPAYRDAKVLGVRDRELAALR